MKIDTEKIIAYLKKQLDHARYTHTLAVVKMARALARCHGVSEQQAEIAALLHDAGKGLSRRAMVGYARRRHLAVPGRAEVILRSPSLLHSHISADIARRRFGIGSRSVLDAIRSHTMGAPRMDTLAKILYIADAVSSDRRYRGVTALRAIAARDLDDALVRCMAAEIHHVLSKRAWLHPAAVAAWNAARDRGDRPAKPGSAR